MNRTYNFVFHTKCQIPAVNQHGKPVFRKIGADTVRELSRAEVQAEIDLGKKKVKDKDGKVIREVWLSPYLLHAECVNSDLSEFGIDEEETEKPEPVGQTMEESAGDVDRNILKQKLDAAGIPYRANAKTENLQKLLDEAE